MQCCVLLCSDCEWERGLRDGGQAAASSADGPEDGAQPQRPAVAGHARHRRLQRGTTLLSSSMSMPPPH